MTAGRWEHKQEYLLWIGRIDPVKGPHRAIEAARLAGRTLVLAGPVQTEQLEYFRTKVEPHIDGLRVNYVGEVGGTAKQQLFANAAALLMPISWREPFGMVMVEALACGTPVIAFPEGAAAEIVIDGENGMLVADEGEMADAVKHVRIDRPGALPCERRRALRHISQRRGLRARLPSGDDADRGRRAANAPAPALPSIRHGEQDLAALRSFDHRARRTADRARECVGAQTRRVHSRAVAAAEQLGSLGRRLREGRLHDAHARAGRTTPRPSQEANAHPEVFAHKTVGQVADHFADVIAQLDDEAGRHRTLLRRAC